MRILSKRPCYSTVILAGPVARPIGLREDSGPATAMLSILVDAKRWVNVRFYGTRARLAAGQFKQGDFLVVHAVLRVNPWKDDEGREHFALNIVGKRVLSADSADDDRPLDLGGEDDGEE